MTLKFLKSGLGIITLLFFANIIIQSWTVGKYVNVVTDEGVYLYASTLINRGLIPYKDFFLGHLPLWIYINAFILKIVNSNMNIFHYIYVVWVSSTIFPIFLTIKSITKKEIGAVIACIIFLTFPEMVQWDSHFFALRQASLPFLAWAIYLLVTHKRPVLTGILLALFGASLFSNYFVIALLFIAYFINEKMSINKNEIHYYLDVITSFLLFSMSYWIIIFATPSSISNIFGFQMNRYIFSFRDRMKMLSDMTSLNWTYFLASASSIILTGKKYIWLTLLNVLTIFVLIFAGATFLPHYLVVASIGIALSMGLAIERLWESNFAKTYFLIIYLLVLIYVTGHHFRLQLIEARNPNFFYAVQLLKEMPSPLFTLEPIYAVFARKDISHFYMVADPRFYDVMNLSIPDDIQSELLSKSNTVLLDEHTKSLLSYDSIKYVYEQYQLVAVTENVEIWTRK